MADAAQLHAASADERARLISKLLAERRAKRASDPEPPAGGMGSGLSEEGRRRRVHLLLDERASERSSEGGDARVAAAARAAHRYRRGSADGSEDSYHPAGEAPLLSPGSSASLASTRKLDAAAEAAAEARLRSKMMMPDLDRPIDLARAMVSSHRTGVRKLRADITALAARLRHVRAKASKAAKAARAHAAAGRQAAAAAEGSRGCETPATPKAACEAAAPRLEVS
ncbi:hypothetical protein Rsub_11532 [Raphidocelis subcapitata]|uniref:Uncharacterized protein n=1 Tax=Raphidocelis subcapitata TaxID=307507 RepID=A0A2V0PGB9_9CHLO|nr:hypothetical protein Rsub_11532 [Raphidocelis subcapitata]|eukprot:GBF98894.1 hypothetical protein Rsub_11532 [Raphidocelis subcapitata]